MPGGFTHPLTIDRLVVQPQGSLQSRVSSQCNVWPALFASRIFRFLHSLLQRIRSHGHAVAKMDIRTSGASIINTASTSHLHCWAFRTPVNCQAIYSPSREHHGLRVGATDLATPEWRRTFGRMDVPFVKQPRQCERACLQAPRSRRCDACLGKAGLGAIAREGCRFD